MTNAKGNSVFHKGIDIFQIFYISLLPFFSLPWRACLHIDVIVQYAQAGIYSVLVFCPIFLHTHTSGSDSWRRTICIGRSDEIVPLNCWTYHICSQVSCSGRNSCSPAVYSVQPSALRPTSMPYTNRLGSYVIHEVVHVLLTCLWDGAGVGLLYLELVSSIGLQSHFVRCKTHLLHHNCSTGINANISYFQNQNLRLWVHVSVCSYGMLHY